MSPSMIRTTVAGAEPEPVSAFAAGSVRAAVPELQPLSARTASQGKSGGLGSGSGEPDICDNKMYSPTE